MQAMPSACCRCVFTAGAAPAQISMYINSQGGVVTSGLAIYDTMQVRRPQLLHTDSLLGALGEPGRS